jgi:type IV pilus assembly protein PilC
MPQYRYQARHESGQVQAGVLAAHNAAVAAAILRNQGHHVLQLVPVQNSAAQLNRTVLKALNYSSGPGQKDILDFTTQLAVMIRAGISLRQALSSRNKGLRWLPIRAPSSRSFNAPTTIRSRFAA